MKLNPDDPRLTAYALNELPEEERPAVEAALQDSPECQQAVDEVRRTAKMLSEEFATESGPALRPQQREEIEAKLQPGNVVPLFKRPAFLAVAIPLAACVALLLVLQAGLDARKEKPHQIAFVSNANLSPAKPDALPSIQSTHQTKTTLVSTVPDSSRGSTDRLTPRNNPSQPSFSFDGSTKPVILYPAVRKSEVPARLQTAPVQSPPPPSGPAPSQQYRFVMQNGGAASDSKQLADPSSSVSTLSGRNASAPVPASETLERKLVQVRDGWASGGGGGGFGGGGGAPVADAVRSVEVVGYVDGSIRQEVDDSIALGDVPQVGRLFRSGQSTETATYPHLIENSFLNPVNCPLSTFSIDVDTASYANVRRFLHEHRLPPRDAVRIEELINYFSYRYPQPKGEDPFAASIESAGCPWNPEHRLVRVGIKGREIAREKRPPSNFVFLIDVSGSMQPRERLPLIKEALRQLVKKMTATDRVAMVVYASEAGVKLESTPCSEKEKILQAIDELGAGGSTNGGDGIRQAYRVAQENFIEGGVNRVLLCTDGDFNVGTTDQHELVQLIQEKAKSGVFLTTLGVGTDNYKDVLMQKLADKGNGNYHYLDTLEEAQKVLIDQMSGTLVTIARDVKIQIEFNPAQVNAYRLIGYEKRLLRKEDFNNDAKDAGEIGAGHTVTALYEIVPAGREFRGPVDDLKYQPTMTEKPERYVSSNSKELLTLKIRYKQPEGERSRLLEFPVTDSGRAFSNASQDFKFAAAVASFGMLLRDSEYKGDASFGAVLEWANEGKGTDEEGYRSEFLNLVRTARSLR